MYSDQLQSERGRGNKTSNNETPPAACAPGLAPAWSVSNRYAHAGASSAALLVAIGVVGSQYRGTRTSRAI